jgi:DNA-binding MarR family transcriptional regulator
VNAPPALALSAAIDTPPGAAALSVVAERVLAVVPMVMREIRSEMRRGTPDDLTVPSFRMLLYVRQHPGCSVSAVAAHLGVTLPTASVAVDKLMALGYLGLDEPAASPTKLRRRVLRLSPRGAQTVARAMRSTTQALAQRLHGVNAADMPALLDALATLEHHLCTPDLAPAGRG